MPDWEQLVARHLAAMATPPSRKREIVAELASHLEDAYDDARRSGAHERRAMRRALDLVPDWRQLSRELSEEADMMRRLRTLWLPGVTMGALAMGALLLLTRAGVRPHILWLGGQAVTFYLPWLLALPVFGALASAWARRAGGSRSESILAGASAAIATAGFFLLMLPISFVADAGVPIGLKLAAFGAFFLGSAVAPGIALLLGASVFLAWAPRSGGRAAA